MYFLKSNKSYNIASFIDDTETKHEAALDEEMTEDAENTAETEAEAIYEDNYESAETMEEEKEEAIDHPADEWFSDIKGIDAASAIKNSGSESAFKAVLKIFYDSINDKYTELERCYYENDWKNYTIKIHALKSSSRLIGAMGLGERAEKLEMAGKENDIDYITNNHEAVMEEFLKYREELAGVFKADVKDDDAGKPLADDYIMESIYEELKDAADAMDCDRIEAIMKEAEEYAIPSGEKERFDLIRRSADMYDYEGILDALSK